MVIVLLSIRNDDELSEDVGENDTIKTESKYVWNKTLIYDYKTNLASDGILKEFDDAVLNLNAECSNKDINNSIHDFVDVLDTVCKPRFGKDVKPNVNFSVEHEEKNNNSHDLNIYRTDKAEYGEKPVGI